MIPVRSTSSHAHATVTQELCLHCGRTVPAGLASYCCSGCRTVHEFLTARGLGAYYELRSRTAERARIQPAPDYPGHQDAEFAYLDDPAFVREYATPGREGQLEMRFYLEGVHCAACVWLTERLPESVPGVSSLRLNLASGVAQVRLLPGGSFRAAARELARYGYAPHPVRGQDNEALRNREHRRLLLQLGLSAMAAGNIMLFAVALYAGAGGALATTFLWLSLALYLPVLVFSAEPFYRSAWSALIQKRLSIDVPIVFGIWVGSAVSFVNIATGSEHIYFDSLSTLVFLLLSTRYLLKRIHEHAWSASRLLHFLAPSRVHRLNPGSRIFEEVSANSLVPGDVIQVLPSETFAVDGEVLSGTSAVNCALITGESLPIAVSAGSKVQAGTTNLQAPLEVSVTHSGAQTRLSQILVSMEESLSEKPALVTFLDRVGQGFIVAVLVLTGIGFLLGFQVSWHEALNRALAVALVVCPCTFALATPLAMSLAVSRAARLGVLVKGQELIERLSRVREIFFDKTGTLTEGQLRVSSWEPRHADATRALVALELKSSHPIARAVKTHFAPFDLLDCPEVTSFTDVLGLGPSGWIEGHHYSVRAARSNSGQDSTGASVLTEIHLLRDSRIEGVLILSDQLCPDSARAISQLQAQGFAPKILSGDSAQTVTRVARDLGIASPDAHSGLSPEQKASLLRDSPRGLMVGDGANDALALASAFASISVQGGMEVSIRAADAYCTRAGIATVPELITISRETMRVIYRNLAFAVVYNLMGVAAALSGHVTPLFAALLMPASALTVFLSTLAGTRRLRAIGRGSAP